MKVYAKTASEVRQSLAPLLEPGREKGLTVVCIGTDRQTGDALGPLVGDALRAADLPDWVQVLGTIQEPVHAQNLPEVAETVRQTGRHILAVDASLGLPNAIGTVTIMDGPLRPGAGVNRELPQVGDVALQGVVNAGGFMEYFIIANTRLAVVIPLAQTIARGIREAVCQVAAGDARQLPDSVEKGA